VPGRYSTLWFQADRVGVYHLFCSQYCGVEHSKMAGRVVVMEPHDYQAWLAGAKSQTAPASTGAELFTTKPATPATAPTRPPGRRSSTACSAGRCASRMGAR